MGCPEGMVQEFIARNAVLRCAACVVLHGCAEDRNASHRQIFFRPSRSHSILDFVADGLFPPGRTITGIKTVPRSYLLATRCAALHVYCAGMR
jgi:hypothetical protein